MARVAASITWSGVLKSGSPWASSMMSTPAARNSRARCAAVADAERRARPARIERKPTPRIYLLLGAGVLLFENRDFLFEGRVLHAAQRAEFVEHREVLLRLGQVAGHQVGLAQVFVRGAVLRIDAQRLVVM